MAFTLNPYNLYDSWFDNKVRSTLARFHINLSHGNYAANGPMVSLDMQWNRNGGLQLSRQSFVDSLTAFNETFHGLQAPDRYHVVDGNVGAVLYRLQGPQTGEFEGIPSTGKLLDIWGGELMEYDSEANLNYLITIEEFAIAAQQLSGNQTVKILPSISLYNNPPTNPTFRQTLRDKMASLHKEYNMGNRKTIAALAAPDVAVDFDQSKAMGREAFMQLFTSDEIAFPDKVFHDDYVLADGHLGAIESVWQGTQTGVYTAMDGSKIQPAGQTVRVRGLLFLEFDDEAIIVSATMVHDEGVIQRQLLERQDQVLYPLYP